MVTHSTISISVPLAHHRLSQVVPSNGTAGENHLSTEAPVSTSGPDDGLNLFGNSSAVPTPDQIQAECDPQIAGCLHVISEHVNSTLNSWVLKSNFNRSDVWVLIFSPSEVYCGHVKTNEEIISKKQSMVIFYIVNTGKGEIKEKMNVLPECSSWELHPILAITNLYKLYQRKAMQPEGEFSCLAHSLLS